MAEHEVKTELKLEDHTSEALHHIGEGFEALDEKVHEVGHEILETFKNAASVMLGFQLEGVVESFKELGHEAFEAATGVEEQEKAIRGVLMITDKAGESLEEMTAHAHELNEQFAELSENTGVAKASIAQAFDEMAERTGMGTEDVARLTEEMANAGRAVPGGINALSEGFSNLSSGMIRAKNPVVQLIAATGMLKGNAKQVADQMKKMSPQEAMQLGIDAIEKMGGKMKGLPLTFNELVTSLKTVREEIFESLGAPILKAIVPQLEKLRGYFVDHKEQIEHWAEVVGEKAGEWVSAAAEKIQEGFQYLEDHAEEIKHAFVEGAEAIEKVVKFILSHAKEIAVAFGVKNALAMGVNLKGMIGKLLPGAAEEAEGAVAAGGTAAKALGGGEAAAEAATAAEGLAAGEAAVAAEAGTAAEGVAAVGGSLALATAAAAVLAAVAVGTAGAIDVLTDESNEMHDTAETAWKETQTHLKLAWDDIKDVFTGPDGIGGIIREFVDVEGVLLLGILDGLAQAAHLAAEGLKAANQAFEFLIGGPMKALLEAVGIHLGPTAHGAGLAKAEQGKLLAKGGEAPGAIKAPPIYNFTGEIHINQDFKDTDPDRIATVFKQSLGRAAQSRVSASTQVPQSHF